jgi:hypothetical protein
VLYSTQRLSGDSRAYSRLYPWLALAAGAVVLIRLGLCVQVFSPTIDEPSHIGAAVSMIEAHKLIAPGSHPPLARLVAAIPLWLDGARLPQCRGQTAIGTEDLGYELGTQVLYDSPQSPSQLGPLIPFSTLLTHARLAMLVFPMIVLFYVYLLGRWLMNSAVAAMAVIFLSVDPTFLGHGFWIGNDMAGCAGYLAATYHGLRWLKNPTWETAAIAGLAGGLAISAKFSCLLIIPSIALIALTSSVPWRKIAVQFLLVSAIAFITLWATYFFNIGPLSDQAGMNAPPSNSAAQTMQQQWQRIPRWVRNTPIPMPTFFLSLARLAMHNRFGHEAYLNGHVSSRGWWYYFPELLALKSPLGFLAALVISIIVAALHRKWRQWETRAIILPAAVFLAAAMAGNIDIGIRYILPAIPFLYLFLAAQLTRPGWIWVLGCLLLCSAVETAAVHPDYLSFFNVAAGGPSRGDRFALDSNLDWNQDVYRLGDWIAANANGQPYVIHLSGRRNGPLLELLGIHPANVRASPLRGLLFVSKNVRLVEGYLPWLWRYEPIAHIGYSIDVYKLTGPAKADEVDDVPPDIR